MHGCPPAEIEAICSYMLTEKRLNTFVKLNPTLLGYENVRRILDNLGYDYITLKQESFDNDLQYPDAVKMLHRLVDLAKEKGLCFGVKLTNTLGSVNDQEQLPGKRCICPVGLFFPCPPMSACFFPRSLTASFQSPTAGSYRRERQGAL